MSDNQPEPVNPNNRDYDNGEIIVHWRPDAPCIKCHYCAEQLPRVFDPKRKPWVMLSYDTSERIQEVVEQCPSGALTWGRSVNGEGANEPLS